MTPLFAIENCVAPDFEAVKRSPEPELSTSNPVNEVDPESEAIGRWLLVA